MARFPSTPPERFPRRVASAYTLFELVVTMSILTILASVAAPKYAGAVARYKVDSAARKLIADIDQTRALARASGSNRIIRFAPTGDSYTIVGLRTRATVKSDYSVSLGAPPYSIKLESASFAGSSELEFNGHGIPTDGGSIVLRGGSITKTIVIDPASGAAQCR